MSVAQTTTLDRRPAPRRATTAAAAASSALAIHDRVLQGLPIHQALQLLNTFKAVPRELLLKAIGISARTLERAKEAGKPLDANASDRALRLAAALALATDVLGSHAAAEQWLASPAMGLERRVPLDLLQTSEGADLVKTLLTRMDHGVYS